jgi:hypothetical protein
MPRTGAPKECREGERASKAWSRETHVGDLRHRQERREAPSSSSAPLALLSSGEVIYSRLMLALRALTFLWARRLTAMVTIRPEPRRMRVAGSGTPPPPQFVPQPWVISPKTARPKSSVPEPVLKQFTRAPVPMLKRQMFSVLLRPPFYKRGIYLQALSMSGTAPRNCPITPRSSTTSGRTLRRDGSDYRVSPPRGRQISLLRGAKTGLISLKGLAALRHGNCEQAE